MLLADLHRQSETSSCVYLLDVEKDTQETASKIAGFFLRHGEVSTDDLARTPCDNRKEYIKALIKGHKAAVQAAKLLSGSRAPAAADDAVAESQMIISKTALVGGSPCNGHAKKLEGITSFQQTHFQRSSKAACCVSSSHYLHFSGGFQPLHEVLVGNKGQAMYDRVCLQSGMCLFAMDMVQGSLNSPHGGSRVDASRLICASPTLYEVEFIARASPVMADITATILDTIKDVDNITLQICLDVPNFHYYHSVHSRLEEGTCSLDEALRWMRLVLRRHEQVSQVFRRYLVHQLARRGVDASAQLSLEVASRGMPIAAQIIESLERGEMPCFDEILKTLGRDDPVWDDFCAMLPPKERPVDFRSLNYLFYMYEVIRPSLAGNIIRPNAESDDAKCSGVSISNDSNSNKKNKDMPPSTGRLVISIDDGAERKIYSRSQKLLKKLRSHPAVQRPPSLLEMYMSRRVFIDSNKCGSNLYLDDPSPEKAVLAPLFGAFKEGQEKNDPVLVPGDLGPYGLATKLYGAEESRVLQDLFESVGLA